MHETESRPDHNDPNDHPTLEGSYRGPKLREWQLSAWREWKRAGYHGIVEAITGTGKSLVGVVAIHQTVVVEGGKALVLVPSRALVDQWLHSVRTALPNVRIGTLTSGHAATFRDSDIIIATVQSAYKEPPLPTSLGVLIADEVHRYGSAAFSKALHSRYERRIGLTGTLERQHDDGVGTYLMPFFGQVTTQYGYGQALRDQVVAPFHLALVGVDFNAHERRQYDAASERCSDAMKELVDQFGYASDWQSFFAQVSDRVGDKSQVWDEEGQLCSAYMSGFAERRRVTAEATRKETVVGELAGGLAKLSGSLVFTETKESARRLAWIVNRDTPAFPLTSDSSSVEREEKIMAFARGRLKVLCAPRILDEGIDVPEAEFALIVAASQTPRQMIQRMGRVIRLKQDGRPARIMVLYVRDTGEDPDRNGHFGFLNEVRGHAASEATFSADSPSALLAWLGHCA